MRSDSVGNGQLFLSQFSSDKIVHNSNCIGDSSEDDHFRRGVFELSLKHAEFGFERDEELIDWGIDVNWVVSSSSAAEDFSLKNVVLVDLLDDIRQIDEVLHLVVAAEVVEGSSRDDGDELENNEDVHGF